MKYCRIITIKYKLKNTLGYAAAFCNYQNSTLKETIGSFKNIAFISPTLVYFS